MQEAEINGQFVMMPACHNDDQSWIAAQIYNITTRRFEGENLITGIQRYSILNQYESTYLSVLEASSGINAESLARRAANIILREKVAAWKDLRRGVTHLRNI